METRPEPDRTAEEFELLFEESLELEGGMGAVAWAVLEMFRRGGMEERSIDQLHDQMSAFFAKPSDQDCNLILEVLETRLARDRSPITGRWYGKRS